MSENQAVILSAVRTPSGRFQGSLSGLTAPKLGSIVLRAAVERAGLQDLSKIDEVIMGNVVTAGEGQAPARQAAIAAGIPETVGAPDFGTKLLIEMAHGLHGIFRSIWH